ncbi:MAG: hypothetical protein ACLGGX_06175 [Bdellovibrionia bacterium]
MDGCASPQEMGYVPQGSGVSLAQYYFLLLANASMLGRGIPKKRRVVQRQI